MIKINFKLKFYYTLTQKLLMLWHVK